MDVLSWIFTESVIQNCFAVSIKTADSKVKEMASDFVNRICGADGSDVSTADGQCECLLAAITVWIFLLLYVISIYSVYVCVNYFWYCYYICLINMRYEEWG